jgi:Putative DNA-binding domain
VWARGADHVSDRARNEILAEVVAFANAHGGLLIIGIEESTGHPKRCIGLLPVRRCAELADRLRHQARDCIEPSLPVIEIEGVPTSEDGSGVVLARVPQSRLAPHRVKPTNQCYFRRADRSETMTMRDIQDLTLQRAQGTQGVEARFVARAQSFTDWIVGYCKRYTGIASILAMRATAIPIGEDLFLRNLHNNPAVKPWSDPLRVRWGETPIDLHLPADKYLKVSRRPILRGAREDAVGPKAMGWKEIHSDGVIEYAMMEHIEDASSDWIFPEHFLAMAASALLTAHRFRVAAGGDGTEYGLELEILRRAGKLRLARFGGGGWDGVGDIELNPLVFPRLSFGTVDELGLALTVVVGDLWNAAGQDAGDDRIEVSHL